MKHFLNKIFKAGVKIQMLIPALALLLPSCKKFLETGVPQNQIVSETVFQDDASALSAVSGIYSEMMRNEGFASGNRRSVTFLAGLSADELDNYSGSVEPAQFYNNSILTTNTAVKNNLWEESYKYIYYANSILEGLAQSGALTESVNRQLQGEAKFIRSFCYLYLVNMFGPVPLATTTDYRVNNALARSDSAAVYTQIISDLKDASALLAADFAFAGNERVRPAKWAALALLARAYLYTNSWEESASAASQLIDANSLFFLHQYPDSVFLKESQEAIWQLKPVLSGKNTNEANWFLLTANPSEVSLSKNVADAFESGDNRKIYWVDSITSVAGDKFYFPKKYKAGPAETATKEYSVVLRLSEVILIRAEARAQNGLLTEANEDLNMIRQRAGLPDHAVSDQAEMLSAILKERQVELFSEWGHRWFDLKRFGKADEVLSADKGADWSSADKLYPVPKDEINNNNNLTQNPGYN